MELIRYDPAQAVPLEGGTRATYMPVRSNGRMTAMLLQIDRRGDTGMRAIAVDVMLVVVSGMGQVRSGGHVAEVQPGDVIVLPGGAKHTIWTTDIPLEAVLMLLGEG